jgi:hypothetical protein
LGEDQFKETDYLKLCFQEFLQNIQVSSHTRLLPFLISFPENGVPEGSLLFSKNIAQIRIIGSQEAYRIRVIPYDPRHDESIIIHCVLGYLGIHILSGVSPEELRRHYGITSTGPLLRPSSESGSWESLQAIIRSGQLHLHMPGTVESFLNALDRDFQKLSALAEKHLENEALYSLVRQELEKHIQLQKKIRSYTAGSLKTEKLDAFLFNRFADCKTISERLRIFDEMASWAQDFDLLGGRCLYLDRILTLLKKEPCACILLGKSHADGLSQLFLQLGYRRVSHENLYTLNYPLLSSFEVKTDFGLKLHAATQSFLKTLQDAKVPDTACHGCFNEFDCLMLCGRCKEVRYCGIPCQRKHWPQHKGLCKEKVTS